MGALQFGSLCKDSWPLEMTFPSGDETAGWAGLWNWEQRTACHLHAVVVWIISCLNIAAVQDFRYDLFINGKDVSSLDELSHRISLIKQNSYEFSFLHIFNCTMGIMVPHYQCPLVFGSDLHMGPLLGTPFMQQLQLGGNTRFLGCTDLSA